MHRTLVWPLALLGLAACSEPTLDVAVRKADGNVAFELSTDDINGLLQLQLWDAQDSELLWSVDLEYYAGAELTYGVVPVDFVTRNGSKRSARQEVPPPGVPPTSLRPGRSYVLGLTCQYDHLTAPSMREFFFRFDLDAEGEPTSPRPVTAGP